MTTSGRDKRPAGAEASKAQHAKKRACLPPCQQAKVPPGQDALDTDRGSQWDERPSSAPSIQQGGAAGSRGKRMCVTAGGRPRRDLPEGSRGWSRLKDPLSGSYTTPSGAVIKYRVPYSSLCAADHEFYLAKSTCKTLVPEEKQRLEDICRRAADEAKDRVRFFQDLAARCPERYHRCSSGALSIHREGVARGARALKGIPDRYTERSSIRLNSALEGKECRGFLAHESVVCRLGSTTIMKADNVKEYLPKNEAVASEWEPQSHLCPIEEDGVARALCEKHEVDLLLTSDTLTRLMSLLPENMSPRWEVPVRVVGIQGTGKRLAIFMDALPSASASVKEILTRAALTTIQNAVRRPSRSCQQGRGLERAVLGTEASLGMGDAEDRHKELVGENSNVFYSTWTYNGIRMLVRYSYMGLLGPDMGGKYVCCGTKVEHSLYENFEEYTIDEMMRWWSTLFLHPNSHLLLARVDSQTEKVVRCERMNRATIDACRGHSFRPESGVQNLFFIISGVRDLKEGAYLAAHAKGENVVVWFDAEREGTGAVGEKRANGAKMTALTKVARGQVNKEVEFVPPTWRVENPSEPQIPQIYPPWSEGKASHEAKAEFFFNRKNQVFHCLGHLSGGKCARRDCPLPHLSKDDLRSLDHVFGKVKGLFRGKEKWKLKKVPHCFAFAQGEPCPFGGQDKCIYPHITAKQLAELEKLCQCKR